MIFIEMSDNHPFQFSIHTFGFLLEFGVIIIESITSVNLYEPILNHPTTKAWNKKSNDFEKDLSILELKHDHFFVDVTSN